MNFLINAVNVVAALPLLSIAVIADAVDGGTANSDKVVDHHLKLGHIVKSKFNN